MPSFSRYTETLKYSIHLSVLYYNLSLKLNENNVSIRKYGPYVNLKPTNWKLLHILPIPNIKLDSFITNLSYLHYKRTKLWYKAWKYLKSLLQPI